MQLLLQQLNFAFQLLHLSNCTQITVCRPSQKHWVINIIFKIASKPHQLQRTLLPAPVSFIIIAGST